MNRIEFYSIWWKHIIQICVLSRNHVPGITYLVPGTYYQCFPARNNGGSHATPGCQPIVDESDSVHGLVPDAASLCFVLAAQVRKLSLSASLGWADGAQNRHARNSDGDAAIIEVLIYPVFSVASRGCRGTWPIELVATLGLQSPLCFLRRHRRGTLCYDL